MAAYRRVFGFCHQRADCRGPGSAQEPYALFEYGTVFAHLSRWWREEGHPAQIAPASQ